MKRFSPLAVHLRSEITSLFSNVHAKKIVIAVSGGIDSISLLDLLCGFETDLSVIVAHFDHRLRPESGADAEFVRLFAETRGCRFICGAAEDSPNGMNLEAWARERRYSFLESVRMETGADYICTAHHRDDQAETLLLRLLSGRLSTKGFGIARVDEQRHLLRPLLNVSRIELEKYLQERALEFRTDNSNFDSIRTRNRVRLGLIPMLEREFNPRVKESLAEFSTRLADDEELLWAQAEKPALLLGASWSHSIFSELPEPLRWRSLGLLAKSSGLATQECGYRHLKLLENRILFNPHEPFELDLGNAIRAHYTPTTGVQFGIYRFRGPSDKELPAEDKICHLN